jgi:hypothetical protein
MIDWNHADIDELSPEAREVFELLLREEGVDLDGRESPIAPRDATGIELSFAQQRLWFLAQLEPDNPFYNVPAALRLTGPLDIAALAMSLGEVVRRHEVLRTAIHTVEGKPLAQVAPVDEPFRAGLMVRSLRALQRVDAGYDPANVLTVRVPLPFSKYSMEKSLPFFQRLLEEIRRHPAVRSVAVGSSFPLYRQPSTPLLQIEGHPVGPREAQPEADWLIVSPDYFKTLGIPLLQGRLFGDRDTEAMQPVADIQTLAELRSRSIAPSRLTAGLLVVFALLAFIITAIGLSAVVAFVVGQRTPEIGLRMALGADRISLLGLVMRQSMLLVLLGLALGWAGALAGNRLLSSVLFGVQPSDPFTFLSTSLALLACGAGACFFPARRAAFIDPIVALRA